jgi:hypothetical protein
MLYKNLLREERMVSGLGNHIPCVKSLPLIIGFKFILKTNNINRNVHLVECFCVLVDITNQI